jgi:hypothetical protein
MEFLSNRGFGEMVISPSPSPSFFDGFIGVLLYDKARNVVEASSSW